MAGYAQAAEPDCGAYVRPSWAQSDRMTTRHWVLMERSIGPMYFHDNGATVSVILGSWRDEMTGRVYSDIRPLGALEIDHVIPLKWAWDHGACRWSPGEFRAFANDRRFLLVTALQNNRQKSDSAADLYLPINREMACRYIHNFQAGVLAYRLDMTTEESTLIEAHERDACRGQLAALAN